MSEKFSAQLLAPCGIYCGTCVAFFGYTMAGKKRKMSCNGCRTRSSNCAFIKKGCSTLAAKQLDYCFECQSFPCEQLKTLDSRYVDKYNISLIENLKHMKAKGVPDFLETEQQRRKCPTCGGVVCIHTNNCYTCNKP
ncbi:MAG: hypothetical protein CW691_07695 [Candidatus Bathyarchaeum sp.]|nr:MAG: hypothetical protein CW691_07695 [Candidatus Bathyarchaeum sp.]